MECSWNSISFIHITLSFLFLFFSNFRDVFAVLNRDLCLPEQRDAILEFKNEFEVKKPCSDGDPKMESWESKSDCCSWDGIKCDVKSGDVITLNLSSNCLNGEIPSSLGNLLHFTSLQLCANNFFGEIPFSLGNLSHLTGLSLYENNFSGEIFSLLGNVSHLTFLDISQNNFVGKIPSSFGSLNQLRSLTLANNKFSGNFPFTQLLNMTKLEELLLYGNQFTGTLPPNMSSLSNLEFFYIQNNAFTGMVPSSLFSIPSLTYIGLENNQFNGSLEFGNISSKIEDLLLGNNHFRGLIPISIFKLVNLQRLDLSHLNTTTVIDLNTILSYSKSLVTLDLSGIHVSVTNKISVSNPPLVLLSQLYLSGCGITEFPKLLRTQLRMTYLDLSNNNIKGEVPSWLWTLPILNYVNLSNNTFVGFERPSSLQEPSMSYFSVANNNFTGNIPSFICGLGSLNTLDLSNNKFNGSIPLCMGNFSSVLQALILRQNRLSGGLPENISKSLVSLDVGHNQLMGKLSRSLLHCSVLEVLNVENNEINDKFPFWLSSLPKLQILVLRSNSFHGPIELTEFSKLRIIDVSHNNFNGTLPSNCFINWFGMSSSLGENDEQSKEKYMGTGYYFDSMVLMNKGVAMELVRILKIYTAIDFSGNRFEGEIPSSIGLLKQLHVLNLSNNVFTGHIPSSMANLIELESLDVSQNKLSGEIPQELRKLTYLAYMNFSHNQLVGLVPSGTQFETQLCSSFEDNPGLYGPSLEKACVDIQRKTSQNSEKPELEEDEEDEEEEVISWIAAVVGFIPGTFLGFTMGYILVTYKPEKHRQHNSLKSFLTHKIFEDKSKTPN